MSSKEKDFSVLGDELSDMIDAVYSSANEDEIGDEKCDISDGLREEILSKIDVKEMTQEEYTVFMDYGIANAVKIFHSASGKEPDRSTVLDLATAALSHAIVTYNIDIAQEKKATFRTHYGWKIRAALITYFRDLEKARKYTC